MAAAFLPFIPFAEKVVSAIMNGLSPKKESGDSQETIKLREEVAKYQAQNAELLKRFDTLTTELQRKKITSFEDLEEQDQEAKRVFEQLAKSTRPKQLDGFNIGLFGSTSTGKSTMLNAFLGQKVAATGVGETTMEITPYKGQDYTLWDVPGRNDEISYMSMKYVAFFKGLSRRLVLIQATVKENSSIMKLLDELDLSYDIVFNKFDKTDLDEQEAVQKQIRGEVSKLGLRKVSQIYFVSSKHTAMFPDWLKLVNNLTG